MSKKKFLIELAAIVIGLAVAFIPLPAGLKRQGMWVIALLLWSIINWIFDLIPDFVCIFVMCCGWVLLGILPFETAFGSFSSSTVWLLIAAMGIGGAVAKSGLLSRAALLAMKICPPTFSGQVIALMGSGIIIGPFIPSTAAKVSIVGAMATDIGEKLGYKHKSNGIAGLWSAMYVGYNLIAPMVLSSSFFAYVILSLLPEDTQAQFTWTFWLISMLPWAIICIIGSYIAIKAIYRPEETKKLQRSDIEKILKKMGPMSRNEKITLVVLVICVLFWILERILGIPSAVTAVLGMSALLAAGVLEPQDYNTRINWRIVAFLGGAVNLAAAMTTVGINTWIGTTFSAPMAALIENPYIFVPVIAIAALLTRFLIVDMTTCYTLYTVMLSPFCLAANMSPWIVSIIAYAVVMPYFVKYQNINFLAAYNSAGGDEKVGHRKLIPFCFAFHVISILALTASVPYWQMLGLIAR